MAPEEYAKGVVNEVMKSSPRAYFWHGAQTFTVWFGETFLWKTCWVGLNSSMKKLNLTSLLGLAVLEDV